MFFPPLPLSHFHIAIFFKFIAANLSLTHFVTCVKPLYCVYRIPYFSFASAKMRSIVSLRLLYNSLYSGIYLASSAFSTHPLQICLNTLFSKLLPAVHFSLTGQLRHFCIRPCSLSCILIFPLQDILRSHSIRHIHIRGA